MTSSPTVVVEHVSRTFEAPALVEPVRALDAVSLDLRAGETTVVIGPSGSGKTTLLNVVAALDRPSSGAVTAFGQPLHDLDDEAATRWRRTNLASIFQAKGLIAHLTAAENVEIALRLAGATRRDRATRALDALDSVGLADHSRHLPRELSGGQQQRVAIARALVTSTPMLVADEPTGELDTETAAAMIDHIVGHVRTTGTTALIATHDGTFRDAADRVLQLVDGRLDRDERRGTERT